ncbi:MAG: hypothetical protein JJU13_02635 [Balneolaceae bacterium]|nr:hypothetical protein [Balneolaceae bacterium]
MKHLFLLFIFALASPSLFSQQISISPVQAHNDHDSNTFPTKSGSLTISNNQYLFGSAQIIQPASWAISEQKNKLAFLKHREFLDLKSYNEEGHILIEKEIEFFDPDDETIQVYQFSDGSIATRDNVANFTFFDAKGNRVSSVSNSSDSVDGEQASQLATDRYGKTIVLYNPVIAYGDETGSRASLIIGDLQRQIFFQDHERVIERLHVQKDGSFTTLIASNGTEQEVFVHDRFGNEIFRHIPEDELRGTDLTNDGRYLTTFTSNRMQVYDILSGERLGSASSQSSVLYATYHPDDEVIVAFGGSLQGQSISSPSVTAVHLTRRELANEDISISLSVLNADDISITRTAQNQYRITGLNRHLDVTLQF